MRSANRAQVTKSEGIGGGGVWLGLPERGRRRQREREDARAKDERNQFDIS